MTRDDAIELIASDLCRYKGYVPTDKINHVSQDLPPSDPAWYPQWKIFSGMAGSVYDALMAAGWTAPDVSTQSTHGADVSKKSENIDMTEPEPTGKG
jgi:hypothetical protein